MESVDFLIVGGGVAGAKCAETLRSGGAKGSIVIVGAEPHLPYDRPPLSKGLLLGEDRVPNVFVQRDFFYEEHGIEVLQGTAVVSVDGQARIATDDQGRQFSFGKLLVATGCAPRRLDIPGSDFAGVFHLKTLDDCLAISHAMEFAGAAVVIGSGFIGMEVASALAQKGIFTTMLVREDRLFPKLGSPELSKFFLDYYRARGVDMVLNDEAVRVLGNGKVEGVETRAGAELGCDLVCAGIGVVPEVGFLRDSGVELNNGVVVDEYLMSSNRDIFAAGDVANYFDPVFREHRRIEHWENAVEQGKLVARNMLGANEPCRRVSYFYSEVFDLYWEFAGDNADCDETVIHGSLEKGSAAVLYLRGGRIMAACLVARTPRERALVSKWILEGKDLSAVRGRLADPAFGLEDIAA